MEETKNNEYEQGGDLKEDAGLLRQAAMLLLEQCTQSLTSRAGQSEIPPTVLKDYGSTLRAIQSVLSAGLDLEEQRARIDKLRRDGSEKKPEDIKIVFADEVKDAIGELGGNAL